MTKTFEALASGETLEIRVYGPIGAGLFFGGVTAKQVSEAIRFNAGFKRIVLKVNSPGGSAFEGMAIRSILASQEVETVAEIEGLAASAGSIAAMGCKTIRMHLGTAMMIHEARGTANEPLDSKKLKSLADALEALNDGMAAIYSKRTGLSKKECRKLMEAETWLTAEQAVADKFADSLVDDGDNAEAMKVAASFDLSKFGYQHVPAQFKAAGDSACTHEGIGLPGCPICDPRKQAADDDEDDEQDDTDPPKRIEVPPPSQETPPPPAATTAEAMASRKRDTMTIKLIATAIGLTADAEESAVVAAVSQLHAFVSELKTLTKAPSIEAVLGTIRGLQAAAEQVEPLKAKVAEQAKQIEAQDMAQLIAADKADPKGRKLTPALEAWIQTQSLEAAKAFLAAAPHVVQVQNGANGSGQQQPAPASEAVSGGGKEPVRFNGKAWEETAPAALHQLKIDNEQAYNALLASYVERGRPVRAQSQQQRASA